MFEIWKRAWRSTQTTETGEDGLPDPAFSKRARADGSSDAPAAKRRKSGASTPLNSSNLRPEDLEIYEAAKRNDTIAVFYGDKAASQWSLSVVHCVLKGQPLDSFSPCCKPYRMIHQVQKFACQVTVAHYIVSYMPIAAKNHVIGLLCHWVLLNDEARAGSGQWRRVTLFVLETEEMVRFQATRLTEVQPDLKVATASELQQGSEDERWLKLMGNDAIVMTYDQIVESINGGSIGFSQINLLLLDRPQLALKVGHPLAKLASILSSTPVKERPKIFGVMPQSGSNFRFSSEHLKLETLLSVRFHGISNTTRDSIESTLQKPKELVIRFNPPSKVVDTPLCKHLRTFDKKEEVYRTEFRAAKAVLREVGAFAADWVWRQAFKNVDEDPMNPIFEEDEDIIGESAIKEAKVKQDIYRTVKNWTFTMPNLDPTSRGFNVSPKITKLVQILQCFQQEGDEFRGVILVRRRITALAIVEVFKTISGQLQLMRPEALVGPWSHSKLTQASLLDDFRAGRCNLLVATKIAEDGIDLPPCTCIIRYDLFESDTSYAQTRAMAKGNKAHLILMLDKNADLGRRIVRRVARAPAEVKEWTQAVATHESGVYPPSTILQTTEGYHSDSDDDESGLAVFLKDPTMSGRIYPQDAVSVIYRYLATLPIEAGDEIPSRKVFDVSTNGDGKHTCTVLFPPGAPLADVQGPPSVSIAAAKRAASFEACRQLHKLGLLSYKLFPRPKEVARKLRPVAVFIDEEIEQTKGDILPKVPPAPAPPSALEPNGMALDAVSPTKAQAVSGTRCYEKKTPEFWKNAREAFHGDLYPTVVTVDRNHNPNKPYRPILIITRVPLPEVESFKLFFATMPSMTYLRPAHPIVFDEKQINLLHQYTIRAMRGVTNRAFTCALNDMPFFIAPLDFGWDVQKGMDGHKWPFPDVSEYIPWDLVVYAAEQHIVPLRTETIESLEEDIKDAVVQDWWTEFTKRYDCIRVRRDLNPLTPLDTLTRPKKFNNLVEFAKAKRKGFEGLVDYDQPLIEVANLPSLINRLSPTGKSYMPPTEGFSFSAKYVIPELCSKFTIPASTMRTLMLLPSIMKRLDDTLLVREFNAMYFNNEINEVALLTAITAPSAGVEFDYERLELLGDAYLKYLSSIYLFVTNPNQHEGILHIARQKIISNRALLVNADKSGLPRYIQSKVFMPKLWVPQGFKVNKPLVKSAIKMENGDGDAQMKVEPVELEKIQSPSNDSKDGAGDEKPANPTKDKKPKTAIVDAQSTQKKAWYDDDHLWLGDKCVADVAESIIGAAFQTGGPSLGLKVVKSLHIPLPFIESWEDFALKAKAPPADVTITLEEDILETVEAVVGAKFHRPHILAQALTHTSVRGNDMTCYERLEFLGDAILDFLVIQHIFDLHGKLSPGALTLLKGAMVSNSALAAISVYYGLHKFVILESESVKKSINEYVPEIEEKQRAEYAAAKEEGRSPGQYWLDVEPPKSVADVMESVLGALYVSDGFTLTGAQAMYETLLKPFYDQHISLKTLSHHPTKILFELFQSLGCQEFEITRVYDVEDPGLIRCEVVVHDVILAAGVDPSPTFAARRASFEALDALEGDANFMPRLCDCRAKAEQRKLAKRAARAKIGKVEKVEKETKPSQTMDSEEDEEDDQDI